MGEVRKDALTGAGVASKGTPTRPALASRGLLLMGVGLAVVALVVGGVTLMSRRVS